MNTSDVNHHILRTTTFAAILATALNVHAQQLSEHEPQGILLQAIGGQPYGTHIGRMRHMDWSFTIASPVKNTYLTGFSYSERGGVLTQLLTILTLTALSPEAGLTFAFEMPPDTVANFGFSIEYLTANQQSNGYDPYQFTAKFNHAFPLTGSQLSLDDPPVTLTWGLLLKVWSLPPNSPSSMPASGSTIGLPLEFAFPVTRWAQIDASVTFVTYRLPVEFAAGATFHLGNRFFVAAGSYYALHQLGHFLRAGVRL